MKKATIVSKAEIPVEFSFLTSSKKIKEIVTKKQVEGIAEEILKIANSENKKDFIEETEELNCDNTVHSMAITIVNNKEIKEIIKEKERLEEENRILKEKVDEFTAVGLLEIIDVFKKAEIVAAFLEEFQSLTEEFAERLNE